MLLEDQGVARMRKAAPWATLSLFCAAWLQAQRLPTALAPEEQQTLVTARPLESPPQVSLPSATIAPSAAGPQSSSSAPAHLPDAPQPSTAQRANEAGTQCNKPPCLNQRMNWYRRFVNGPQVKPLTPEEKGWLALRNLADPFNAITILGEAGIAVGSDAHSPYGPGVPGYGRNVGVSYTEDLTGEFFNTFLICSLAHQDPHYHRQPHASYFRRSLHAVTQVVWTQGDNERGMLNYANLVGFAIDDEIANLYVPGRETNSRASADRYAIGLASAPISNFITEFLPDVANHIHVQVVIVQRIINQVALKEQGGQ